MNQNTNKAEHIPEDNLVLLALQFLPERELPEAIAHLSQCSTCRDELGRIQGDLAAYALTADMHSPPAYARERLLRKVGQEKAVRNRRSGAAGVVAGSEGLDRYLPSREGRTLSGFWAWGGWAFAGALAVAVIAQTLVHQRTDASYKSQVAQMETQSAHAQDVLLTLTDSRAKQVGIHLAAETTGAASTKIPEAHAAYMADSGSLVFFASNLQPLQPYKTYELWLLPANGRGPIAAGIFKPDASGNANILMPNLPKGVPASGFGITIEDEGGAKQPTMPIVMSGT